jgi:hypothetical protein
MWRACFLAIGLYALLLGAECMVIEQATLRAKAAESSGIFGTSPAAGRVVVPPEWAPWSLMSAGAIVVLYSFTLPKRVGG